jgi:hypothetical protein
MVTKVTKLKLKNLLGETPKQEESRLRKEKIKLILKGKPPITVREVRRGGKGYLAGTTKEQRRHRKKILTKAGLF